MQIRKSKDKDFQSIRSFMEKHLFYYEGYMGGEKGIEDKIGSLLTFQANLVERLLKEKVISFSDFMEVLEVDYLYGYSLTED